MKRLAALICLLILCTGSTAFAGISCGTMRLIDNLRNQGKSIKQLIAKKPSALVSATRTFCETEDFYDSVYTRVTPHFEIFYTLDGPHQAAPEFIDSLEKSLEYAWNFHVQKTGMRPPLGIGETYHYQKQTQKDRYPIEILDIDLLRDTRQLLGGSCHGCFGLTLPFDSTKSELIIDNDFLFTPEYGGSLDSTHFHGKSCTYTVATESLQNTAHAYPYSERWNDALRITTAHELYHAIQLRYLDMLSYFNFWFEGSAAGIENIVIPDVDDYISYLDQTATSVGTPLDRSDNDYGASVLFLHLYHHVAHNIDKLIWEGFSKNPAKPFQEHLTQVLNKKKLNADSIFHDFALRLAFAGNRSSLVDSAFWIDNDQPLWPDFNIKHQEGTFTVYPLASLAYEYHSNGEPDLSSFTGHASAVSLKHHSYSIRFLPTTNSIDSLRTEMTTEANYDSTLWVLSHFNESEIIPTILMDSTLRAYPTPWRQGPLCFTPLPQDEDHIEIRNRRGNLVEKVRYSSHTLCIEEDKVKSMMVPGVYRFRAGNRGKTKDFIIIY